MNETPQAGPVREQPHFVLALKAFVTGEGSAQSGAAPFGGPPAIALCISQERSTSALVDG